MRVSVLIAMADRLASELACRELNRHSKHFRCIGCADTCKEILRQVAEHKPDVAVVSADLAGEPAGGLKTLRELRASGAGTRGVIVVDYSEPEMVINAFSASARGVFCRSESSAVLRRCIQCVYEGQIWANSSEMRWIVEALAMRAPIRVVNAKGKRLLTSRQEEIVRLVAEGLSNSEISSNLRLSNHTVKNHLFRIYEKLGISNRVELLLYAWSSKYVQEESSAGALKSA